ncbi:MAG: efflux RND transporter permease subunit [Parvularculaceae bacterium]|nr:efflux RND transporter permease subunit [Parvularculaceae bacterium]
MLKNIIDWWGRNPVAGNLLMLASVIAGLLSFSMMEKEFQPAGQGSYVNIRAVWPGASPGDVESQVTVRFEEATQDIDGIKRVFSTSSEGFSSVNLQAEPGVEIDALVQQVKTKIDGISGLPAGIEPPQVSRNVNRSFSISIAVHGEASERVLREVAKTLRDRIALIPGGANTELMGDRRPEVSIEIPEAALRRYGLTIDDVAAAVRASSFDASSGRVRSADGDYQLSVRNLAETESEFAEIVIRETPAGGAVRLGDIASVIQGFEDRNVYVRVADKPSILVTVFGADRFNIFEASRGAHKIVDEMREELPAGVEFRVFYDELEDYKKLMTILFSNALQGFFLIFVLLLLTLHPKVAFWATLGVMTAFAGSFFILPYVDVSLNFMAVFGFLLVLGIMVDDAIIVGEAVYERAEREGRGGADVAIMATQLVAKPLVASVLVTMMAFSPWMLLSGDVRVYTRAISIVVMSTLVFSLIESLIILPAHLAHVSPPKPGQTFFGRLMALQQKCARSVIWVAHNLHGPLLRAALRWRYLTLSIFLGLFLVSVALMTTGRVRQVFFPEIEGDFMMASIEMPISTPFARMKEVAAQLENARKAIEIETTEYAVDDPNTGEKSQGVVRSWVTIVDDNVVRAYVTLTPPESRSLRSKQVTERMTALMGPVPDAEKISFDLSGNNSGPAVQIALNGENIEDLRAAVEELKAKLLTYDAVHSVRDSEAAANEELQFTLKPGAEQLGVTLASLTKQVRQAYFGEEVQRQPRDGDEQRVYIRYPEQDRRSLASLDDFRVRTADGREIPLSTVAEISFEPGVVSLMRRDRKSSINVEAEAPRDARKEILSNLEAEFFPAFDKKYPTVARRAVGEAEAEAQFLSEIARLLILAVMGMYFLLAVVFRSYVQPALILSAIPFAVMGAIIGHLIFGASFAMFSYLGAIAAMGVVVNDNVVLVDRINQMRAEGMSAFEAAYQGTVSRFRQIFLTSVTEFIGLSPMIFEKAAIAQFLKPMALALAYGVLICMPVTLILTPCFYLIGKDVKDGVKWISRLYAPTRKAQPAE